MLFIEGAAGMSGDMTVGALLSLGACAERLKETLDSLRLGDEFSYVIAQKSSYGIAGTDFDVILPHAHAHAAGCAQPTTHNPQPTTLNTQPITMSIGTWRMWRRSSIAVR